MGSLKKKKKTYFESYQFIRSIVSPIQIAWVLALSPIHTLFQQGTTILTNNINHSNMETSGLASML